MRFEDRNCPCSYDCHNRSAFCRTTCEPFRAYEEKRMEHKVCTKLYSGDYTAGKSKRMVENVKYKKMTAMGRM